MIRDYQLSQLASVSPISFHIPFLFASNAIKLMQLFTIFEARSSEMLWKYVGFLPVLLWNEKNYQQVAWATATFLGGFYWKTSRLNEIKSWYISS